MQTRAKISDHKCEGVLW